MRKGIVEKVDLNEVDRQIEGAGNGPAAEQMRKLEPELFEYVNQRLIHAAGKLAVNGAPTRLVQQVTNDNLATMLVAVGAMWRAQHRLWKDVLKDTPLGHLADLLGAAENDTANEQQQTDPDPSDEDDGRIF